MQHISTADVEIINVHNLLLAQKSLTRTKSLSSHKSLTRYISTSNTKIVSKIHVVADPEISSDD
jgi:hypothetical protein